MPKACSRDLRERVTEVVEEGTPRREAAERFEVSASTAVKWVQSLRREGKPAAKSRGGGRSPLEDHTDEFLRLVAEQPDWTLEELIVALRKQRISSSRSGSGSLWNATPSASKEACDQPSNSGRGLPARRH